MHAEVHVDAARCACACEMTAKPNSPRLELAVVPALGTGGQLPVCPVNTLSDTVKPWSNLVKLDVLLQVRVWTSWRTSSTASRPTPVTGAYLQIIADSFAYMMSMTSCSPELRGICMLCSVCCAQPGLVPIAANDASSCAILSQTGTG